MNGRSVLLLDGSKPKSGTKASGGHIRPEWIGGMLMEQCERSIDMLRKVWHVYDEQYYDVQKGKFVQFYRVDSDELTKIGWRTPETVSKINDWKLNPVVTTSSGEEYKGQMLILASGIWTNDLLPPAYRINLQGKQGISFRFKGELDQPFTKEWAPYKQIVAHQQTADQVWIGDGTSILEKNWDVSRREASLARCQEELGSKFLHLRSIEGVRPYVKPDDKQHPTDPCYFKQLFPRVFVVTGSNKSGTISAGWSAIKILEASNGF